MFMKSLKRYISMFIVLLIIFFVIFLCVHFLSKGYTNSYKIDNYKIKEIYTKDEQGEHDNYYIEINSNNIIFNYQFYKEIEDDNKIVKDVIYYDGEYKCLLPILSDNIKVDFLCYKNGEYHNYIDIVGKDSKLDSFIEKIDDERYNKDLFKKNKSKEIKHDNITYMSDNMPDSFIISMTTLKGLMSIVDGKIITIDLFDNDVYKRELSTYVDNYYVSANYSDKQEFSEIYVVNILNGKKKIIKAPDYISFDSYIQGIVDDSVYIYDVNNEKQYKIDISESSITEVGNSSKGIRYYDGNWSYISSIKANNKTLFKDTNDKSNSHYYIYQTGKKLSGFMYFFYESDSGYDVYRANVQNKKLRKYLFSVKNISDVVYEEEYVFFKTDHEIKVYSDYTGVKTILKNSELEFNENIGFTVYRDVKR